MRKKPSVNHKSVKAPKSPPSRAVPKLLWKKCSVAFSTGELCNAHAMSVASRLYGYFEYVYFARYINSTTCRLDLYYAGPRHPSVACLCDGRGILLGYPLHLVVSAPSLCDGSLAHARAFKLLYDVFGTPENPAPENPTFDRSACNLLFADLIHWMANMLNLDYTQEGELYLYGLHRIFNVFATSIRKGSEVLRQAKKHGGKVDQN